MLLTSYFYQIDGKKLTEIINEKHENVKYLPGIKLPENVVAVPSAVEAARGADLLIFVLPHQVSLIAPQSIERYTSKLCYTLQFIPGICQELRGKVSKNARAISMIKGVEVKDGNIRIFADVIEEILGCKCSALSGANIANEGECSSPRDLQCKKLKGLRDYSRRGQILRDDNRISRRRS